MSGLFLQQPLGRSRLMLHVHPGSRSGDSGPLGVMPTRSVRVPKPIQQVLPTSRAAPSGVCRKCSSSGGRAATELHSSSA